MNESKNIKSFQAKTLHEALQLVRQEMGPHAAVLRTREVRTGWLAGFFGGRQIEIQASPQIQDPTNPKPGPRSPLARSPHDYDPKSYRTPDPDTVPRADREDYRQRFRSGLMNGSNELRSLGHDTSAPFRSYANHNPPAAIFELFTSLVDADIDKHMAEELVRRTEALVGDGRQDDLAFLRDRLARALAGNIHVSGPICPMDGQRRLVALIGPTGVGKTTTIAKLAANFRLREKKRVGLITVDTYRIAAVDQLRTYAEIIDLPMEVVSTPREMAAAVDRMSDLDLVLLDTAGRGPREDVRLQELRTMLVEARADEVHLVVSAAASGTSLCTAATRFLEIGATHLIVTKLDEAVGLGNLIRLFEQHELALSYVTDGQNVPDDIRVADNGELARMILGEKTLGDPMAQLSR